MTRLAEAVAQVRGQRQGDINHLRQFVNENYPDVVKALRKIDRDILQPKRRKGFSLVKRENKEKGFLYYARYSHNGKTLPTKFNTRTNDLAAAERYARDNKNRLVDGYLARQDGRMYAALESFYKENSEAPDRLSERSRKEYGALIHKKFIPFLKLEKITAFDQIKRTTLAKFQDSLLSGGAKPQTVNNNIKPVKKILAAMARKGIIEENPGSLIKGMPVRQRDRKERGCYELDKIKGVFNRRWKDETSYLLCLLIYTTGMRNSEIKRIKHEDIKTIDGCRFISVKQSKTPNGIRLVPLHGFVYRKLKARAAKNKIVPESALFGGGAGSFNKANNELAGMLKISDGELEAENITFYSGRHYWKTLMNAGGLGEDIEEIFMGHKASGNAAKLYNHRDKQGKRALAKKARQVFSILDRNVFKAKP